MSIVGWKRDITIDLDRDRVGCAFLEAYQNDKRANCWSVHVLKSGAVADLDGFTARALFVRPDGNTVDIAGSISDNTVSVELDEHVYVYLGRASGALVIEDSTHSITLDAMKLNILKRDTETITPDDEHFVVIGYGTLDTEAQTVVGAINELNAEIEGIADAVLFTEQELTDAQQAQARENIGAGRQEDLSELEAYVRDMSPVATVGPADMVSVDDAAPLSAEGLVVNVEPVQAGSGDPSPENIRPITGWDGVTAKDEGKNLLDNTLCVARTNNGVTRIINDDGTITLNGTSTSTSLWWKSADDMNVPIKAGTYTLSIDSVVSGLSIRLSLKNSGEKIGAFTLDEDDVITNLRFYAAAGTGFNNSVTRCQLELGSTASAFEPYKSRTASVDFGQTVYGGTVDLVTGECVVDRAMVDMGDVSWNYNSNYHFHYNFTDKKFGLTNIVNEVYPQSAHTSASTMEDYTILGSTTNGYIFVNDPRYTSASDFAAAMAGYKLLYELTNPITLPPLTPAELALFKGINNISADAGQVTVTYRQDVFLALNKRINELQALVLES